MEQARTDFALVAAVIILADRPCDDQQRTGDRLQRPAPSWIPICERPTGHAQRASLDVLGDAPDPNCDFGRFQ
jgi:hypothetical protein